MSYEVHTPLKPSQKEACEWLINREQTAYGECDLYGGLFCDPPGMGKTLSMIAAILSPDNKNKNKKCPTLIVVPPQVIQVWLDEFSQHTNVPRSRILVYYGKERERLCLTDDIMFVITSYGILRNECLKDSPYNELDSEYPRASLEVSSNQVLGGPFMADSVFNNPFYRVVLDEAHLAKNHKTKLSCALTWLDTKIKWIITATPKINNLDDEYGSFRFLGIFNSWEEWRSVVPATANGVSEKKLPMLRNMVEIIESIKKEIMLCRPKELLSLPPKVDTYVELEFSNEERAFYDALQIYVLSRVDSLEQTAESAQFREYSQDINSSVLKMIGRLKMATNNCFFVVDAMSRLKGVRSLAQATAVLSFYNKRANRQQECMICEDCEADHESLCGHKFCLPCWKTMFCRQNRVLSASIDWSDEDNCSGKEDFAIGEESSRGRCPVCSADNLSQPHGDKVVRLESLRKVDTPIQ
jgi:SNF2 family DNA or RNA helicase